MADTWMKTIDLAVKTLLFAKFTSDMGFGANDIATSVVRAPKDIAMRQLAEKNKDVALEFISYWRDSVAFDWARQSTPVARRGMNLPSNESGFSLINVKAIPVKMEYTFYVYTKKPDVLNDVTSTYMFWQQDNPNLDMTYNGNFPVEYDLHFSGMSDESTVDVQYSKGAMYIGRFGLTIDGWLLESDDLSGWIESIHLKFYEYTYPVSLTADYTDFTDDTIYEGDNNELSEWEIDSNEQ